MNGEVSDYLLHVLHFVHFNGLYPGFHYYLYETIKKIYAMIHSMNMSPFNSAKTLGPMQCIFTLSLRFLLLIVKFNFYMYIFPPLVET